MASLGNGNGYGPGNGHGGGNGRRPKGGSDHLLADRLPPQNLEAEMGVLGSILCEYDVMHEVDPVLEVEDFYRDSHQTVYRAMRGLYDSGHVFDAMILADELVRLGEIDSVGGVEFLAEIVNSVPHSANARYYADIVKQKSVSRAVVEKANEALRRAYSNQYTAEELVSAAQADFLAIGGKHGTTEVTLYDAVGRAVDTLDRRSRGEDPGIRIPFPELNRMLDGFRPGRLYVLGGRPGSGKSAFIFETAVHAASHNGGVPALFFSIEMDAEELGERYISAKSKIDGYGLKYPAGLCASAVQDVMDAYAGSAASKLRIDEEGGLTVTKIAARARRCKHRHGLGILFVDYLQLIDGEKGKGENRQEEVARVSMGLKRLAKELRVPLVAACQLNRAVENRPAADQVPRMSDLRESGQMDADAHAVLLFHAPTDDPSLVNVIVAKNRGGATGVVPLKFVREQTRFEDRDLNAGYVPQPDCGLENSF